VKGKPLQPQLVRAMAEAIRRQRVKGLNRFKKRQRNLSTERVEKIEGVRNAVTVKELENWFVKLSRIVQDFNILPENIYNMDETGFNISDFEARHVVIDISVNS